MGLGFVYNLKMARAYQSPEYFNTYKDFIPEFDQFLSAQALNPPIVIRRNTLKCSQDVFEAFLDRHIEDGAFKAVKAIEHAPECYEISAEPAVLGGMWEHHVGLFYIMGASSLLPVLALDPKPGESILDMSAAPGGKTCLIAQAMGDSGLIVANEPNNSRRRILKSSLDRMGVSNAFITNYLGEEFPLEKKFDRILLDGPCSAEGSLRGGWSKSFDYQRNDEYRQGLQRLQLKLLKRSVELLKDGGRLVYSTCTYDPLENEVQLDALLKIYPNLKIVDSNTPGPFKSGVVSWQGKKLDSQVLNSQRVYPHFFNSWGFFFATIIK